MKKICELLIRYYKRFISPSMPNTCIYTPTCSAYALDAIKKYGVIEGILRGGLRILRCNPFRRGGFDPVPENYRGNAKWLI